jgi:hypothetical protein
VKSTAFNSEQQLTGTLDAALKAGDKLSITVKDTAGTSTPAVEVTVAAPPTVSGVTATAGATTITVAGDQFTKAAQVLNNGTAVKSTQFDNVKQLTGTLDAALKTGDKLSITVKDDAGTSTPAVDVTV